MILINLLGQRAQQQGKKVAEALWTPTERKTQAGQVVQVKVKRSYTRHVGRSKPLSFTMVEALKRVSVI